MAEDFETYLKKIKFSKHFKKLNSKLKNKTIIVYGSGSLFIYIKENFDLSNLNIIGISDMKFTPEQEGDDYLGYKIIPKNKIVDYKPDYVLIATQNYVPLIESFVCRELKDTDINVAALAKKPLFTVLKEIWS